MLKADGTKFGKTETETVWLDARRARARISCTNSSTAPKTAWWVPTFATSRFSTTTPSAPSTSTPLIIPSAGPPNGPWPKKCARWCTGPTKRARAEAAASALYAGELSTLDEQSLVEVCAETPTSNRTRLALDPPGLALVDALVEAGLVKSKNEARRLVTQGGVYVNDRREKDTEARLGRTDLLFDRYLVLRKGRDYHLVSFE